MLVAFSRHGATFQLGSSLEETGSLESHPGGIHTRFHLLPFRCGFSLPILVFFLFPPSSSFTLCSLFPFSLLACAQLLVLVPLSLSLPTLCFSLIPAFSPPFYFLGDLHASSCLSRFFFTHLSAEMDCSSHGEEMQAVQLETSSCLRVAMKGWWCFNTEELPPLTEYCY